MSAPLILHGPGAREEAEKPPKTGRTVWTGEPKKDSLREMLSVLLSSLTSSGPVQAVIGPLDLASSGAFDLLLKSLEELDSNRYRFVLWAKDLSTVPKTVVSRCREVYLYKKEEDPTWDDALALFDAYQVKDFSTMSKMTDTADLVAGFVHVLATQGARLDLDLWGRLRQALQNRNFDGDAFFTILAGAKL